MQTSNTEGYTAPLSQGKLISPWAFKGSRIRLECGSQALDHCNKHVD